LLEDSYGSFPDEEIDGREPIPWLIHQGRFGVTIRALEVLQMHLQGSPRIVEHFSHQPNGMLVPDAAKQQLSQLALCGMHFEPVVPIVSFQELDDADTPADLEVPVSHKWTRRYRNIVFGEYPAHMQPWWVLTPTVILPPMHPLLIRTDARRGYISDAVIDDVRYRGPVHVQSSQFDQVPPIYTPEAVAAMPPFDVAWTYESFGFFGKYSSRLIVSARGKELMTPFFFEPKWTRVGILPTNSPVLGGTG
jgi:hypothetical protein